MVSHLFRTSLLILGHSRIPLNFAKKISWREKTNRNFFCSYLFDNFPQKFCRLDALEPVFFGSHPKISNKCNSCEVCYPDAWRVALATYLIFTAGTVSLFAIKCSIRCTLRNLINVLALSGLSSRRKTRRQIRQWLNSRKSWRNIIMN